LLNQKVHPIIFAGLKSFDETFKMSHMTPGLLS
jgi:hypothetical protein